MCYYLPVRVVFPNHEVVLFQPRTLTAPKLGSVANAYTYSIPPTAPVPSVFCIFVSTFPRKDLLLPPHISPIDTASLYLCTCFFPLPFRRDAEHPSTCTASPPASLHPSFTLPSHSGRPKEFLAQACVCLPSSGCPPFVVLDLFQGPCPPQGFSYQRVPSSLCMPTSSARPLPPLPSATGGPVPCQS